MPRSAGRDNGVSGPATCSSTEPRAMGSKCGAAGRPCQPPALVRGVVARGQALLGTYKVKVWQLTVSSQSGVPPGAQRWAFRNRQARPGEHEGVSGNPIEVIYKGNVRGGTPATDLG